MKVMEEHHNPQIIYSWHAPLRAYKKRSAGVLRFYLALALLLSLIVFFLGDKILVLPIWALMFLFYVLTITPPPNVTNRISKFGVESAGNTYRFEILSHFYFIKRFDYNLLVLVTHAPYLYHMYLVVQDNETKKELIELLSEHLVYKEHPDKTIVDKISEWFTKLMPDEESMPQGSATEKVTSAAQPL